MHIYELVAIPALMLLDYRLTIMGARARRTSGIDQRILTATYELNPVFRKDVDSERPVSSRHLLLTVAATFYMILVDWLFTVEMPEMYVVWDLVSGFVITMFLVINGNHIRNLATFAAFRKHPEWLTGELKMDHALSLRTSGLECCAVLPPLALVMAQRPSWFVAGCAVAPLAMFLQHKGWEAAYEKKRKVEAGNTPK